MSQDQSVRSQQAATVSSTSSTTSPPTAAAAGTVGVCFTGGRGGGLRGLLEMSAGVTETCEGEEPSLGEIEWAVVDGSIRGAGLGERAMLWADEYYWNGDGALLFGTDGARLLRGLVDPGSELDARLAAAASGGGLDGVMAVLASEPDLVAYLRSHALAEELFASDPVARARLELIVEARMVVPSLATAWQAAASVVGWGFAGDAPVGCALS